MFLDTRNFFVILGDKPPLMKIRVSVKKIKFEIFIKDYFTRIEDNRSNFVMQIIYINFAKDLKAEFKEAIR